MPQRPAFALTLLYATLLVLSAALPASAETIDDFETYVDTADLQTIWPFADALDTTTPNPASGSQSMRREGFTGGPGSGWSTRTEFDPPLNLSTALGVFVWARRHAESVDSVRVSLSVRDAEDNACAPQGMPFLTDLDWHRIDLDFAQWCGAVDLSQIASLSLNVSNQTPDPGDVAVSYDDVGIDFGDLFADGFESGDLSGWASVAP